MSFVDRKSRAGPAPTGKGGDGRTLWYRRLAWVSLFSIIIILTLPGHWIEALQVWALTWWPWPSSGLASSPLPIDKVIHASLFAVCAALFVRGWTTFRERWWVICLMLFLYGVVTEVIQYFVPGRSASIGDLLADAAGGVIGVVAALAYLRGRTL